MAWELSMQHVVSGYLPLIPILFLYFIILFLKGIKQTFAHIFLIFVFCFYLIGILAMTGVWWFRSFSPKFVWIPFIDMVRGPIDTLLNIVLFIPLGLFLPLSYQKFDKIGKIALAGFLISLSIEIIQMFGCGATDINDLITNTAGTCLGYYIYLLFYRIISETWRKAFQVEGIQCYYEPAFYWIVSLLIMTTIQLNIFDFLF